MKLRQFLLLTIGVIFLGLLASTVFRNNFGISVRYFSDEADRWVYYQRGIWLVNGQVPYRDVLSEYPQVPTYLFGLFEIPTLGETDLSIAYGRFSTLFSLAMLFLLALTIKQLYELLPQAKQFAYLLLLPAPLYFTYNRFDILPAYLCLVSYAMISNKKWGLAAFLLGLGAMTKWYPALLLPAYLVYFYRIERRINWKMILVFSITCFLIVLPTFLAGGVDAVMVPYSFHNQRGLEAASLPWFISNFAHTLLNININQSYLMAAFLLLQVIAIPFLLLRKIDRLEILLQWCILIITMFVLFGRIYSPQWLLWILPFLILASKSRLDIWIIVLYGTFTYLGFPVAYDMFGAESFPLLVMGLLNIAFLVTIAARAILKIRVLESVKTF